MTVTGVLVVRLRFSHLCGSRLAVGVCGRGSWRSSMVIHHDDPRRFGDSRKSLFPIFWGVLESRIYVAGSDYSRNRDLFIGCFFEVFK